MAISWHFEIVLFEQILQQFDIIDDFKVIVLCIFLSFFYGLKANINDFLIASASVFDYGLECVELFIAFF